MTVAVSKAVEDGAEAVICRLDRQHRGVRSRLRRARRDPGRRAHAARAPSPGRRSRRRGCSARRVLEVRGDFDEALAAARELAARGTHVLVNSAQPVPARGAEDRRVRDRRGARRRPGRVRAPVRRRRQHDRLRARRSRELGPRDADRLVEAERPARRRWPRRSGSATRSTRTSVAARSGARSCTRAPDERDRRRVARARARRRVSSASRRPRPGSPRSAAAPSPASGVVVTITGHGLKDTASADALRAAARCRSTPTPTRSPPPPRG